ncbi:MAG: hypothetical protein NTW56_02550 [Alphaproteobacteria bacterium]|nr:hypothetical protein [Alphaproteobacteria bacterium]
MLRAPQALVQAFHEFCGVLERHAPENGEARMMVAGNAMFLALLDAIDAIDAAPPSLDPDAATTRRTVELFLAWAATALAPKMRAVTSVNVVEISVVSEVAIGQAALGGSCRVSF